MRRFLVLTVAAVAVGCGKTTTHPRPATHPNAYQAFTQALGLLQSRELAPYGLRMVDLYSDHVAFEFPRRPHGPSVRLRYEPIGQRFVPDAYLPITTSATDTIPISQIDAARLAQDAATLQHQRHAPAPPDMIILPDIDDTPKVEFLLDTPDGQREFYDGPSGPSKAPARSF